MQTVYVVLKMSFLKVLASNFNLFPIAAKLTKKFYKGSDFCTLTNMPLVNNNSFSKQPEIKTLFKTNLNLIPSNYLLLPSCGMKVKGKVKLRCKNCYFASIEGRLHVFCDKYPRHKQMITTKKLKHTWILSHACQSKIRPY